MSKRTTIFKQLILNVVIPAIIAIMALGIINVQQTWSILDESSENKSTIISEEIKQLHEMQDMAMRILEKQINPELQKLSETLVNDVFKRTDKIETADLDEVMQSLGVDDATKDLYVINKNGVIVNTTYAADKGLNLFSFGEEHRETLEKVWEGEKFYSEQFTVESSTKRLRKFTYIPTLDGQYLIELGVYSSEADSIIDFVKARMNNMNEVQSNILAVDLFFGKENPLCLNGDAVIDSMYFETYSEVMETKQRQTIDELKAKPPVRRDYIFMDRQDTNLYKESVIRIISDVSDEVQVLRRELAKFALVFAITVLVVIVLLYRKTRVITDPIKTLVSKVNRITAGHLNERASVVGNNEITSLSEQFNDMISQLESYYNELEEKVRERTAEVVAQKEEIEAQRDTLQEQRNLLAEINDSLQKAYDEIEDSIHYASRIQNAILPPDDYLKKVLPNAFFFYRPRDIVSGDFYWVAAKDDKVIVSAVDCTGHGVPGAFMSIVGNNQLNYALNVENATVPADILHILDEGVMNTLRQTDSVSVQDGMDLAMVCIDKKKKLVQYSGAFNPLILVRDGEVIKYKADRVPIGGHYMETDKIYTNQEIKYKDGDMIYMYSDGYPDQFGGEKGGKYMSGKFVKYLQSIAGETVSVQDEMLDAELKRWMGEEPQIDDILVIGIRL